MQNRSRKFCVACEQAEDEGFPYPQCLSDHVAVDCVQGLYLRRESEKTLCRVRGMLIHTRRSLEDAAGCSI